MEKQLFNLKFSAKRLERAAKKCQKEELQEREKLKKAMVAQNPDCARIHAESAVRKRHEATSYLQLSARLSSVAARLHTAITMKAVSGSMLREVVSGLEKALEGNKLEEVSRLMGRFEEASDGLAVQADSLGAAVAGSVPAGGWQSGEEVALLLQQVADEQGLAVDGALNKMPMNCGGDNAVVSDNPQRDILEERLAKLREL